MSGSRIVFALLVERTGDDGEVGDFGSGTNTDFGMWRHHISPSLRALLHLALERPRQSTLMADPGR